MFQVVLRMPVMVCWAGGVLSKGLGKIDPGVSGLWLASLWFQRGGFFSYNFLLLAFNCLAKDCMETKGT